MESAENLTFNRQTRECGESRREIAVNNWNTGFSEPEVEQLGTRPRQHDVAGLEIAMGAAGAVCRCKGIGNLNPNPKCPINGQCAILKPPLERLPF